jgi:PhnB protein
LFTAIAAQNIAPCQQHTEAVTIHKGVIMPTRLNPYLSFKDNAREAMEFYKSVFGGDLNISTFKDGGMPSEPGEENLIMHSQLETANDLFLMGADTPTGMEHNAAGNGSISLSGEDEAELRGYWDGLSKGGTITMPLEVAPWGDAFGMLTDKFGVNWMVNITGRKA